MNSSFLKLLEHFISIKASQTFGNLIILNPNVNLTSETFLLFTFTFALCPFTFDFAILLLF
jgi:hypothetical protein